MKSQFFAAFRSYSWSQKDPQRWYNFGIESPRDSSWKTSYFDRFGATQRFAFFFLPRLLFGALSNASQQDFSKRMLRIFTLISCEDMLHRAKSSKPISTPQRLHLPIFFWIILHEVSNTIRKTPSHLTSWWWDPSKGSASCNALFDQALIKKPQGIKKSLRFHAARHGLCLSFSFDLMNFDFGLHFGFDVGSCFATTIFVNATVTMLL